MKVLVDFDNVPKVITRQGPAYVADRILAAVGPKVGKECESLELRLYGGWDRNFSLTQDAQKLNAKIAATFPKVVKATHVDPPIAVRLSATLAQSLESLPKKLLQNTVRSVSVEKQMSCHDPTKTVCRNSKCPLPSTAHFITSGKCPINECNVTPSMLLKTTEQKLVDTMMVADLIHLAEQKERTVALVSSDDDLWPGILTAVHKGTHIVHIQTKGWLPASPYITGIHGMYTQTAL